MHRVLTRWCGGISASLVLAYVGALLLIEASGAAMPTRAEMLVVSVAVPLGLTAAVGSLLDAALREHLSQVRKDVKKDAEKLFREEITVQLIRLDSGQVAAIRSAFREEAEEALRFTADTALRAGMVARATASVPHNGGNVLPFAQGE